MCVCVGGGPACRQVVPVPSWPPLTRLRNVCNDPGGHGVIKVVLVNAREGVTTAQPFLEAPPPERRWVWGPGLKHGYLQPPPGVCQGAEPEP